MKTLLNLIIDIFNFFHAKFVELAIALKFNLTDKQLHFFIIGIIFFISYLVLDRVFKWLSKYSISLISFIVIFSFSVVATLAIEVGQYQSGSGQMDFKDVTWGLYGVVIFILGYEMFKFILKLLVNFIKS